MNGKLAMMGALLAWGGWGVATRQAMAQAHPLTVQWLTSIPHIVLLPFWYFVAAKSVTDFKPNTSTLVWTFASCVLTLTATLFYNVAMKTERPSSVIAITSAYPVISLMVLIILGLESFSWSQLLGCLLIAGGAFLVHST
jgi:drug/metabolite transporter (DMT)-like permease